MIVIREAGTLLYPRAAVDDKAIGTGLNSARCKFVEFIRDGLQAVGLLDAQLASSRDDGIAFGEECRHGNDRDFIDEARHDFRTKRNAAKLRSFHTDICSGLTAARTLVLKRDFCSHVLKDIEDARARRIDADIPEKQAAALDNGTCYEPVSC